MLQKRTVFIIIVALSTLLSGCGMNRDPITSESEGIWNHFFVYPFSWVLTNLADLFQGSYGMAIIFMTFVIRLCLLPLFMKQQKSTVAMRELQPEMEKLKEKYDTKNQQQAQKFQQEMMQLYSKNGVNPAAGCLPVLIQMPILMAFYFAIVRTEEIANHSFLWLDLGQPDPLFILPVAAGAAMFLQTKITMKDTPQQMKVMMYLMPVMIIAAGAALPSALSLYWFTGGIFMIFQSMYFSKYRARTETASDQ
ncbi:membrane protein insertase YidC [Salibacterium aidingense]|uniref:membrane protein insertase YidC n=1 Tax=Salibacterium aidingense TaxID=384933 RepID=UPI0006850419|nr:membrane protein insertase YidC [Salibacterium aidingense]